MSRNSSTSSSDRAWRRYCALALLGTLMTATALYGLILIVDPYDSVPFSPAWDRYPVRNDHRHWNAKLVQKPGFDSAVIGSSSSMLLKPVDLNARFGGSFVNLSMPGATPFESLRLLDRFKASHPPLRTLIVGLDSLWCHPDLSRPFTNDKLRSASPEWLYDDVVWNDLPPFNRTTLKATYDQARALLGLFTPYQRWLDGYEDISRSLHKHNDPESIRKRIYEGPRDGVLWRARMRQGNAPSYPDLNQLADALADLPPAALKILFFSPYHVFHQPEPGSAQAALWDGCKEKAAAVGGRVEGLVLVDFLRPSRITRDDRNYIDGYHFTPAVADELTRYLEAAVRGTAAEGEGEDYRILARSIRGTPSLPAEAIGAAPGFRDSLGVGIDGRKR